MNNKMNKNTPYTDSFWKSYNQAPTVQKYRHLPYTYKYISTQEVPISSEFHTKNSRRADPLMRHTLESTSLSSYEIPFQYNKKELRSTLNLSPTKYHRPHTEHFDVMQSHSSKNISQSYRNYNKVLLQPQPVKKTQTFNLNYNKQLEKTYDEHSEHMEYNTNFKKKTNVYSDPYYTPKVGKNTYDTKYNSKQTFQSSKKAQNIMDVSSVSKYKSKRTPAKISTQDFYIGKLLGCGRFGKVYFARHKLTGAVFALKQIQKKTVISSMMIAQLILQLRLQSSLSSPYILKLYGYFDDATYFYLILQHMQEGTLYDKFKEGKKTLSEPQVSRIVRSVAKAVNYLQDLSIAHRDIKPQNILFTLSLAKLCDFGWATYCDEERRKTYCGTFDYTAPEILQGQEYDMSVDLWGLGILTYELLVGKSPFYHISKTETTKRILKASDIAFPSAITPQAKDFIEKLICKKPTDRIKPKQALAHPFLQIAKEDFD